MTVLAFVADVLKTLTWPTVFVIFIFLFRVPLYEFLKSLATRAISGEVAGNKIELGVKEVSHETDAIPIEMGKNELEKIIRKANKRPVTTVRNAWKDVIDSMGYVFPDAKKSSPIDMGIALKDTVRGEDKFKMFVKLKEISDQASCLPEFAVSTDTAVDYAEAAYKLSNFISQKTSRADK